LKNLKTIFSNKKEIIITLFIIVFLFLSIKPFLFTINYFIGNYHIKVKGESSEKYVLRGIKYNPGAYKYFGTGVRTGNLIKAAVLYEDISIYNTLDKDTKKKIELKYKDNFYFQNVLNNLDKKREWQHLDEVSYFFLREKKYNRLTISILDKLNPEFDKEFLNNILDFLKWQDNIELFNYIKKKHKLNDYEYIKPENAIKYKDSILKVKDILFKELNIEKEWIGNNLIESPDFENQKDYNKYWFFSNMINRKKYGEASFYVDLDKINNRNVAKILNLFIYNSKVKHPASGGLWYKPEYKINLKQGFYIFSFDYWTKTGKEKQGFWLSRGIRSPRLPYTKQKWKKVIYILNNKNGKIESVRPLIRMFGKGSFWIDNVFLGKLELKKMDFEGRFYFKVINL